MKSYLFTYVVFPFTWNIYFIYVYIAFNEKIKHIYK